MKAIKVFLTALYGAIVASSWWAIATLDTPEKFWLIPFFLTAFTVIGIVFYIILNWEKE